MLVFSRRVCLLYTSIGARIFFHVLIVDILFFVVDIWFLIIFSVAVVHSTQVFMPVGIAGERFRADRTLVWLGARVYVQMLLQLANFHETLVAVGATVGFVLGVRLEVFDQTILGVVDLPAHFANVQNSFKML